nr:NAD-dependent protein deacylase [bacterium]
MVQKLQQLIDQSHAIVFFGGAGVSTESGIPDYRSTDGLYRQHFPYPPEVMLSHSFFVQHPADFFTFYRTKMIHLDARPNPAHIRLAELEASGRLLAVITQNIDGLHQMAGSRHVLELHGSVHRNHCLACGKLYDAAYMLSHTPIPRCSCGGIIKPDVVLYEEPLDNAVWEKAVTALDQADLLIVGGTSLNVYPAAGLVSAFHGPNMALINREKTAMDSLATLVLRQNIGEVFAGISVL